MFWIWLYRSLRRSKMTFCSKVLFRMIRTPLDTLSTKNAADRQQGERQNQFRFLTSNRIVDHSLRYGGKHDHHQRSPEQRNPRFPSPTTGIVECIGKLVESFASLGLLLATLASIARSRSSRSCRAAGDVRRYRKESPATRLSSPMTLLNFPASCSLLNSNSDSCPCRAVPSSYLRASSEVIDSLRSLPRLILQAPTGSGKSTQVPQILLDEGLAGNWSDYRSATAPVTDPDVGGAGSS